MEKTDRFFDKGFITQNITDDISNDPDLVQNKKYYQGYQDLMRQEGNQLDAINRYRRSVIQTFNLSAAIIFLCVMVYRQN